MAEKPVPKVISSTDASNNFGSMIDEAARGRSYFIVTRMGKARAVVLGLEQYRDLLEDLDIKGEQNDSGFQAALAEAKKDCFENYHMLPRIVDRRPASGLVHKSKAPKVFSMP